MAKIEFTAPKSLFKFIANEKKTEVRNIKTKQIPQQKNTDLQDYINKIKKQVNKLKNNE